jgi:hypothetical protein
MFEQDRFIVRLQQRVMREGSIEICFLAGSFGMRREDAFSDLDVVLIFGDAEAFEVAWRERRAFARSVLPYVPAKSFDATHVQPYFHVALYGNGAKVDYLFTTRERMRPTAAHREIRILKDQDGWAEAHQAASAAIVPTRERMEAAEMATIDDRFWVMFWDVYRLLMRGDTDKPFTVYLELLYFTLPPLLRVLPVEDPAYQGLLHAHYGLDATVNLQHMSQLKDAYVAARTAVLRRHHVGFVPDSAFERSLEQTMSRRTS